jgi:putative membrane protein
MEDKMQRNMMLGTIGVLGLALLAACNQETSYNTPPNTEPTANTTTAASEPAPGSKNDTVSAVKDAVSGGVGAVNAQFTTSTKGFVEGAVMGDIYEIEASKIALNRAKSADVKKFAQQMVDAHTATTKALMAALKSAPDVTPPTELDSRHKDMLDNLKGAKAEDFDGRYIAQQINAHDEALVLMRGYAKSGDNAEIKVFAAATEPKVQMHLDMIKDVDNKAHQTQEKQAKR